MKIKNYGKDWYLSQLNNGGNLVLKITSSAIRCPYVIHPSYAFSRYERNIEGMVLKLRRHSSKPSKIHGRKQMQAVAFIGV